VVSTTDTSSDT